MTYLKPGDALLQVLIAAEVLLLSSSLDVGLHPSWRLRGGTGLHDVLLA